MRRRPPVTIVAYCILVLAILVGALIVYGPDPPVLFAVVILGGGVAGLYYRIRVVWILVVVFEIANVFAVLAHGVSWWSAAFGVARLALLLAPPSRRYFRREAPATARGPAAPSGSRPRWPRGCYWDLSPTSCSSRRTRSAATSTSRAATGPVCACCSSAPPSPVTTR